MAKIAGLPRSRRQQQAAPSSRAISRHRSPTASRHRPTAGLAANAWASTSRSAAAAATARAPLVRLGGPVHVAGHHQLPPPAHHQPGGQRLRPPPPGVGPTVASTSQNSASSAAHVGHGPGAARTDGEGAARAPRRSWAPAAAPGLHQGQEPRPSGPRPRAGPRPWRARARPRQRQDLVPSAQNSARARRALAGQHRPAQSARLQVGGGLAVEQVERVADRPARPRRRRRSPCASAMFRFFLLRGRGWAWPRPVQDGAAAPGPRP